MRKRICECNGEREREREREESVGDSVTRFGRILKVFGQCVLGLLNICQNCGPIFANFYAFGQILIVANGQILKNDSSHLVTLVGDILFVACLFVHSFVVSVVIDLAIFERFCRQIFLQNVAQIVLKYLGYFL